MASRGRRAVLSLTTRFCLPHEGMTKLDYLSSGSAVVLQTSSGVSIATCQHVACPWFFPRYFESTWSWLQFVDADFVRHSLQLLAVDGTRRPEVLLELPLAQQVQNHGSRDLALLKLSDSDALERWQAAEKQLGVRSLVLQETPCERGDGLFYSGHIQLSGEQEDDESFQLPKTVDGHFVGRSSSGQEFAWSQELLEEGMCGGAVLNAASDKCVGLVEGIVPVSGQEDVEPETHDREAHAAWHMRQALAGHVAFIPSSDVKKFIEEPEDLLLTGMGLPPHL